MIKCSGDRLSAFFGNKLIEMNGMFLQACVFQLTICHDNDNEACDTIFMPSYLSNCTELWLDGVEEADEMDEMDNSRGNLYVKQ